MLLMLLRPLLWYFIRVINIVKKDRPMALAMYIWKLNPRVKKSSLLMSQRNLKRRIAWMTSSPKFSKTISGKRALVIFRIWN